MHIRYIMYADYRGQHTQENAMDTMTPATFIDIYPSPRAVRMDLQTGTTPAACIPPELHACPIVIDGAVRDVGWLLAHDAPTPSARTLRRVWSAIWNASTHTQENGHGA